MQEITRSVGACKNLQSDLQKIASPYGRARVAVAGRLVNNPKTHFVHRFPLSVYRKRILIYIAGKSKVLYFLGFWVFPFLGGTCE